MKQNQTHINIIGAGRLGKTLGRLIKLNLDKLSNIQAIYDHSIKAGESAIQFIGEGKRYTNITTLPTADITFITVPDDHIKHCAELFAYHVKPTNNNIIAHCSGSYSSKLLSFAREKGYLIATAHPIRSFSDPQISVNHYAGTYCAIEGDKKAVTILDQLFTAIGSKTFTINSNKKSLYHAGLVFASNYLLGISAAAISTLQETGIEIETTINIVLNLMQGTLDNLSATRSPKAALTGPIERGDLETIKSHLASIKNPELLKLYQALGEFLLDIIDHDEIKKRAIFDIMTQLKKQ